MPIYKSPIVLSIIFVTMITIITLKNVKIVQMSKVEMMTFDTVSSSRLRTKGSQNGSQGKGQVI